MLTHQDLRQLKELFVAYMPVSYMLDFDYPTTLGLLMLQCLLFGDKQAPLQYNKYKYENIIIGKISTLD